MKRDYLARHRAHDYAHLVERWRAVAKRAGLVMRRIVVAGGFPIYTVRSPKLPRTGTIYISAGIHGDEPAGTEGLITWAERNIALIRKRPFFFVPCINPWGLVNNSRNDAERRDLNRAFQDDKIPQIAALKRAIGTRDYAMALMLHEDYDGVGLYIYEMYDAKPYWGEALLEIAKPHVPAEWRNMIEGREAEGGIVRPVIDMTIFEEMGLPEAVYVKVRGCPRVFTIETPSEYGLDRRVAAQVGIIGECVRRIGKYEL